MADIYVKRHSVVSAEMFDPGRTDQGVTMLMTSPPGDATANGDGTFTNADGSPFVPSLLSATMVSRGRVVSVRPGDMLVTEDGGSWPSSAISFGGMYQLLADVVQPDAAAVAATGGNQ